MNTKVGKIAKMIITNESPETPIQRKLAEVGKTLGLACLGICVFIFFIGLIKRISPIEMFMTSVGLAVAAIPEGLPAIVTIVLSIGVTKMAKKNSIIRKLPAVETLGSSSVICSDKTGTLTQNKMQVVQVVTPIDIGKNLTISLNNYFNNNVIDKHNSNNFLKNNSNVIDKHSSNNFFKNNSNVISNQNSNNKHNSNNLINNQDLNCNAIVQESRYKNKNSIMAIELATMCTDVQISYENGKDKITR